MTTPVLGPPGAIGPQSFGLNDAGQIVGSFLDSAVVGHGFLQNPDGTTVIIDFPGASRTEARGINNSGQIVGKFNDMAFRSHGFLRNVDGSFVQLDMPFATTLVTEANGINDAGQIVGSFNDGTKTHGFSRTPEGTFTSFDVPGAIQVSNLGIDSHGNTVGFFVDAKNVGHGFVQRPGATLTVIDLTGAVNTSVGGINDSGQIVGAYFDGSQSHGFAMAGPVTTSGPLTGFTVLDDPRVFPGGNSGAAAINNLGAIVGTSQVFDFEGGFLATLAGVQLCSAATPFPCKPCSRNFTPGATRVIFPNAHMWLSNSWTSAQSYYRARSCSSDLSTCIANFEGLIDASWVNPVTRRTVPACQVQNADSDTYRPLPYPAPPRTLHDANSCFVDRATMPNFAVTTFFPNFGSLGSCSALPVASVCGFTTHRPVPDDDNDD